jgi:hypothetical protein
MRSFSILLAVILAFSMVTPDAQAVDDLDKITQLKRGFERDGPRAGGQTKHYDRRRNRYDGLRLVERKRLPSNLLYGRPTSCIRTGIYGSFLSSAAEAVNRWVLQTAVLPIWLGHASNFALGMFVPGGSV